MSRNRTSRRVEKQAARRQLNYRLLGIGLAGVVGVLVLVFGGGSEDPASIVSQQ